MRMAASWSGPHEAHRRQARGAMTRARGRTPLGLARNRLPAQQTRRNAAAEPLNTNLDIDVPIQALVPPVLDRGSAQHRTVPVGRRAATRLGPRARGLSPK